MDGSDCVLGLRTVIGKQTARNCSSQDLSPRIHGDGVSPLTHLGHLLGFFVFTSKVPTPSKVQTELSGRKELTVLFSCLKL